MVDCHASPYSCPRCCENSDGLACVHSAKINQFHLNIFEPSLSLGRNLPRQTHHDAQIRQFYDFVTQAFLLFVVCTSRQPLLLPPPPLSLSPPLSLLSISLLSLPSLFARHDALRQAALFPVLTTGP
jgi:hypothetical protein